MEKGNNISFSGCRIIVRTIDCDSSQWTDLDCLYRENTILPGIQDLQDGCWDAEADLVPFHLTIKIDKRNYQITTFHTGLGAFNILMRH